MEFYVSRGRVLPLSDAPPSEKFMWGFGRAQVAHQETHPWPTYFNGVSMASGSGFRI